MYDIDMTEQVPETALEAARAVDEKKLIEFSRILESYSAGRKKTADRILSAENWWKLHNTQEAVKEGTSLGADGGFTSRSGWMHNVVVSKHADAMDAYPEALFLPREEDDEAEARMLEQIIPCILEQNSFEQTYSDAMWQKCKTGTGAYKIGWDPSKLNGLGDISITCVNLLDLYWQPEIKDIQKSRYFFHVELIDKDILEQQYPEVKDKIKGQSFVSARFQNDEHDNEAANRAVVIEVYYHKDVGGRKTLQYCKYTGTAVLYATENETEPELDELGNVVKEPMAVTGLYDHGYYPYVFDSLYPVEGSPCGYGYVDVCRNPQIAIDLLKTSIVKNGQVGATPRYFNRGEGNIKENEFLDLNKPIVHVSGNLDDISLRPIDYNPLSSVYVSVLQDTIQELRETSGNTETSTGTANSGVTAAAAIAALQRASGKGSRDASRGSYRAFTQLITMATELIRQFYDLPRKFRILGETGAQQYVTYTNEGIKPQPLMSGGEEIGYRLPTFDIKIVTQQANAYTAMAQNELAIQLYQMGVFQPQQAEQSLIMLDMMDFEGKDKLIQKIRENAIIKDTLFQWLQIGVTLPDPMLQAQAMQQLQQIFQAQMPTMPAAGDKPSGSMADKASQNAAQAPIP